MVATGSSEQTTPDLAPLVQEIVLRGGWASGNTMVFTVSGSGARVAESYDGVPTSAPVLEIDYRIGSVPPDTEAPTALELRGEASDNASAFGSSSGDITSRPMTGASASWNPPGWNNVGEAAAGQRTPDLSAIVQEIVDRGGWSSGNALVFVITGSGARVAESWDGSPAQAPELVIEYIAP